MTIAILGAFAWIVWTTRHDASSSDRFKLAAAGILVGGLAINPVWHSYDQVFELPALLLLFHWRHEFRRLPFLLRGAVCLGVAAVAWQWVAAGVLTAMAHVPGSAEQYQWLWLPSLFSPFFVTLALAVIGCARLTENIKSL
jgi:hypothetical protein